MDLQAEKLELMKLLLETDDIAILNEVKAVFKSKGYDFFNDLPDIVKESINSGLTDVEKGNVYDHNHIMQDLKAKYGLNN